MQFEPLCLICKHPEVLLNTEFTDIRFFNVLPMCGFESPSKIDASIFFATSLQNSKYRFCGACCFLYVQKKTAQGTRRVPGVIDERCLRQIQRGDNGAAVGGKTTLPGSFSPDTARMVVKRPLFLFIIKISSERESVLWAVWDFYANLFLKPF